MEGKKPAIEEKKKPPMGEKKKLPPVAPVNPQMETVSPATRLLEKRRLMYEKQEEYEATKKKFKS